MNIAIVISSLNGGGSQRAAVTLAEGLLANGHAVAILTESAPESDAFPLDSRITRIRMYPSSGPNGRTGRLKNKFRQLAGIRRAVRRSAADVAISFIHGMNEMVLLALSGTRIPVIVSERSWPRKTGAGRWWKLMRFLLYPAAAAVVSVSRGIDGYFSWIRPARRFVIPCAASYGRSEGESGRKVKRVIAVGRLVDYKGFDILLRAFASLAGEFRDWDLVILGEGPERRNLESLAAELGVADRVSLPGWEKDPRPRVMESSIFVLSSRQEGSPNALLEAMACGTAAVSFDCPTGPSEIIVPGENGLLVEAENGRELAAAIGLLMRDPELRGRLAENAAKITETHSKERIVGLWDELLRGVVDGTGMGTIRHGRRTAV